MEKPLSVKRAEFDAGLIALINGCGLPPFAVLDVMQRMTGEVDRLARQQYEADKKAWEESMKGATEDA